MTATHDDITQWLESAKEKRASHLIVVCDEFDHSNHPVYAYGKRDCQEKANKYQGQNMQVIDEIYNLYRSIKKQLAEVRAMNI